MLRFSGKSIDIMMTSPNVIYRKLGGYEKLLSRTVPGEEFVALSHGSSYIFSGVVSESVLLQALTKAIKKHPFLNTKIITGGPKGDLFWAKTEFSDEEIARKALSHRIVYQDDFESEWKAELEKSLNKAAFNSEGPLFKLVSIQSNSQYTAWVFCVNHGIDDQQSINIVVSDLLSFIGDEELSINVKAFPPSMEEAVAPQLPGLNTLLWSLFQLGTLAYTKRVANMI